MTWVPHEARETVETFLRSLSERHENGTEFSWAITMRSDDRPFGMIGVRPRAHMVDIGYVLGRKHWNRGYMTEAISNVSDWFLSQQEIFRVWAVCDIENVGSARVLEKSGFEREGLLRRWVVLPNRSSEPRDCYVYSQVR